MRRSVTCYSTAGKRKGHALLTAFAKGCGGRLELNARRLSGSEVHVFYGVNERTLPLQLACARDLRPWLVIDNGYFGRGKWFRVTWCRRQHGGVGPVRRPCPVPILPWRLAGAEVVIALQHPDSYRLLLGKTLDQWLGEVTAEIAHRTDREIRVRSKPPPKGVHVPLEADLRDAHCLVTWTSNAAVDAVCMGVPAIVLSDDCAARVMAAETLDRIDDPPRPEGRERWAAVLASNQWTIEEMADGRCWTDLQSSA